MLRTPWGICRRLQPGSLRPLSPLIRNRPLLTLAIETSCDDTSVAILETYDSNISESPYAILHFHEKVTANSLKYRGIHPLVAAGSHDQNLAALVDRAIRALPPSSPSISEQDDGTTKEEFSVPTLFGRKKPDFVSVTRGPGMFNCLSVGLNVAKGLAVGWQVPLVGVHHMQAHALTPRLVHALQSRGSPVREPAFPFFSLLVSGGHTLLVRSEGLTEHSTLAETSDVAIGDALDKMARCILPNHVLGASEEIMYGRLLEDFAFPNGEEHRLYVAPGTRAEEVSRKESSWGWALAAPLAETRSGHKSKSMEFSFSGLGSAVKRICDAKGESMTNAERMDLAREAMRVAFEHLASRVVLAFEKARSVLVKNDASNDHLVVSGGVASNKFLRTVLRSFLDKRGYANAKLSFPPPSLCTDNAAMIAWGGLEMYEAGWESGLGCRARKTWPIGEVVDTDGWEKNVAMKIQ